MTLPLRKTYIYGYPCPIRVASTAFCVLLAKFSLAVFSEQYGRISFLNLDRAGICVALQNTSVIMGRRRGKRSKKPPPQNKEHAGHNQECPEQATTEAFCKKQMIDGEPAAAETELSQFIVSAAQTELPNVMDLERYIKV